MYHFLAHFPKIDYTAINSLRKIYDPNYGSIDPHVAVLFPIDASIREQNLISHIELLLSDQKSFQISLKGLQKSWDHYLYLTVQNGKDHIISLHDTLYTGLLSPYLLKDLPYIPHITLGFFADKQAKLDKSDIDQIVFDNSAFDTAVTKANSLNMNFETTLDRVTLIRREDKTAPAVMIKEFLFDK